MENNITFKHLLSSDEKLKWWGYGEWVEEPDEAEFEHHGILCKIRRRNSLGHFCGYCRIPKNHMDNENKDPYSLSYDVHGGITYGELDENREYWIGFDCAHSGDTLPSYREEDEGIIELKLKFPDSPIWKKQYRNIQFVIDECKSLAEQIVEIKKV